MYLCIVCMYSCVVCGDRNASRPVPLVALVLLPCLTKRYSRLTSHRNLRHSVMTAVAPSNDFEHCDSHKDLLKVSERLDTSHEIALHSPPPPLFAPAHPPTYTLKYIQPSLHTIATMQAHNEATEDRGMEAKANMLQVRRPHAALFSCCLSCCLLSACTEL
jgi:hypothetical protein